ncbi:MAG: hypothetical protein A2173_04305 [Planctomycetes bacterium RBG_13_44_8b]|nr:MAG: hypothetical protein A2173_04305 [Planctomycetes bacterium RBG_13_44_8b]
MTKKNLINFLLVASYFAFTFIIGCIPKDSLQWSADGSIGIYSKDGALFLVDGKTGALTKIATTETTTMWPAVSSDGSLLAYGQIIKVDEFKKAINSLPPGEVKLIKTHAEILKQRILIESIRDNKLPGLGESISIGLFSFPANAPNEVIRLGESIASDLRQKSYNDQHTDWINRYLIENADEQLAEKIGPELIKKIKDQELTYFQLILAPIADLNNKKILATSSQQLWRIRFSPDGKLIAYVTERINGDIFEVGFDLYIASLSENIPAALVEKAVAIGYDFRPDCRAIAYLKPEVEDFDKEKFILGSLVEQTIIDSNGRVLAEPVDPNDDENTTIATHTCTGPEKELAGVGYYSWMYISYARDGRIFFTSAKMSLPSSKLDVEKATIFCCDTLTGAISEILPQIALDFTESNCYLFTLSHDSQKILLPGNKNTLGIYALGQELDLSKILIDKNESFGDDSPPKLVSQWKGRDQISCLVAENSHYICPDPNTAARRKEIVILDIEGKLQKVLSKDWPDELLDY